MTVRSFLAKALHSVIEGNTPHPRNSFFALGIPRTNFDYAKEVGTGLGSNVIMSPVQWVMRTFPESPLVLNQTDKDGAITQVASHPFLDLMKKPNEFYTHEAMIMSVMLSWSIAGNAYLLKVRNQLGMVVGLWYVPHWMIRPVASDSDPTVFISHYNYNPFGQTFEVPVEDVIHFRFGLDPQNVRMGLSPLAAIVREAFTDDEASNYSASLLRNMGVPGVVISPDGESITTETALTVKEKYKQSFTGDRRGDALVMTGKTKVDSIGFDPSKMGLGSLRDISEERVTAAMGIPAAVVGFGSGVQTAKVGATLNAFIRLAWTGNIIPSQRPIAETLTRQLLVDFDDDPTLSAGFDNSNVSALQEDKDARVKRLGAGVREGWVKVSDARLAEGLPVEESDKVYLRPLNIVDTPE